MTCFALLWKTQIFTDLKKKIKKKFDLLGYDLKWQKIVLKTSLLNWSWAKSTHLGHLFPYTLPGNLDYISFQTLHIEIFWEGHIFQLRGCLQKVNVWRNALLPFWRWRRGSVGQNPFFLGGGGVISLDFDSSLA